MSKPKPISISIPQPCTQGWDEMMPAYNSRHCAHCQKTVIDFTEWSDTALHQFLNKNTGGICGRVMSSQLDRPIAIPYQPHSRLYLIAVSLGLTLLFTQTPHLLAQSRPPITVQNSILKQTDTLSSKVVGEIKGTIVDEKKEPMIYAIIQVYQDGVLKGGTISDFDGNYSIKPLEPGKYDVLTFSQGYDSMEVKDVIVDDKPVIVACALHFKNMNSVILGELRMIYKVPLTDPDQPTKRTFSREDLNQMPH